MSNNNTNSNKINVPEARAAMEQFKFEEMCIRDRTNAAGHTFPTGLRMAQPQVIQRHIHRTQSVGTGTNAALHIPMQTI